MHGKLHAIQRATHSATRDKVSYGCKLFYMKSVGCQYLFALNMRENGVKSLRMSFLRRKLHVKKISCFKFQLCCLCCAIFLLDLIRCPVGQGDSQVTQTPEQGVPPLVPHP